MMSATEAVQAVAAIMAQLGPRPEAPIIDEVTYFARGQTASAHAIATAIARRLFEVPPHCKVAVLYLIDSVLKRSGPQYIEAFAPHIVNAFTVAFAAVGAADRAKFHKVLGTWKYEPRLRGPLFRQTLLDQIETRLAAAPPAAPAPAPAPTVATPPAAAPTPPAAPAASAAAAAAAASALHDPRKHAAPAGLPAPAAKRLAPVDPHRPVAAPALGGGSAAAAMPPRGPPRPTPMPPAMPPAMPAQPSPAQLQLLHAIPRILDQFHTLRRRHPLYPVDPALESQIVVLTQLAAALQTELVEPNILQDLHEQTREVDGKIRHAFATIMQAQRPPPRQPPPLPPGAAGLVHGMGGMMLPPAPTGPPPPGLAGPLRRGAGPPHPAATATATATARPYQSMRDLPPLPLAQATLDNAPFVAPHAVTLLYDRLPLQCSQCGDRFPQSASGQAAMERHMDWHFRHNRRQKETGAVGPRGWYLAAAVWCEMARVSSADPDHHLGLAGGEGRPGAAGGSGDAVLDALNQQLAQGSEGGGGGGGGGGGDVDGRLGVGLNGDGHGPRADGGGGGDRDVAMADGRGGALRHDAAAGIDPAVAAPPPAIHIRADELGVAVLGVLQCAICHEPLEKFWDDAEQLWLHRNARVADGQVWHATCWQEQQSDPAVRATAAPRAGHGPDALAHADANADAHVDAGASIDAPPAPGVVGGTDADADADAEVEADADEPIVGNIEFPDDPLMT
ncbi:hypothetical protein CXG81DRAFT_26441 [Caulochytrium protostelioides]|uniref:CID domain-containing protein n=1 Tax=Caulochytrium protostelioides TaxID=1555241 RepID=A0A4P9X6N0_9FUNG|nr:hypothetical protein CXG81DRAFT_26441 [Caulochytrium protostelioides]|eukprot:RKP00857.1 hypothetical protein CXG81DRAFT_26441 [Caulochytrium protostelioides]